jgi:Na+-driven multidrug efflux pump
MGKSLEPVSVRILLLQMLSHALIFAGQNAGNFAERALLAGDVAATAALGRSWTAFCLLSAFTASMVNVCPFVVGRCAGAGDAGGARAAAGQALLLAGGGSAVGLAVCVAAGVAAAFSAGPARAGALFLATQGLALGPLLAAQALTGYFGGSLRVGPRLLTAVSLVPIAVHLGLAWLLTGGLGWSVAGAGLARLGAALAAAAAALAVAWPELGDLVGAVRRPDRARLRAMVTEGSVLGLQQVVAGLMVLLLYLTAGRAGDVTAAALTLTHSGVYPLLFAFAWGGSQAVGAAAAQAAGRGDARGLARATWLCLGLSAVLAFALPWGAFAAGGGPTLAWLAGGGPTGGAVRAAAGRFMGLLAVFFVFDFAINFLSALLRAAKEQAYLLKATAAAAAGFGLLVLVLPPRPGVACLMGTFIVAQAAWAVLLLVRVAGRWPRAAGRSSPAPPGARRPGPAALPAPAGRLPDWADGQGRGEPRRRGAGRRPLSGLIVSRRPFTPEDHPMDPLQRNTALPPRAQRALALGLLIETLVPPVTRGGDEMPVPLGPGEGDGAGPGGLWQALRFKCGELSALVLRADDPAEAAGYVLGYLPKHFDYVFEQLFGRKRLPAWRGPEAVRPVAMRGGQHGAGGGSVQATCSSTRPVVGAARAGGRPEPT